MATKRYRIYKAGGEKGRVMNPTAMWFAQMGAQQPSEEEMMMMQQSQGQPPMQGMPPQQPSPEEMAMIQQAEGQGQQQNVGVSEEELMKIMQALEEAMNSEEGPQALIAEMLQGQVPPEIIVQALAEIGVPGEDAEQLVMSIIQEMQAGAAQQQGQQQGQPQMSEEEMMAMQQQQEAPPMDPAQEALAMGKNGYIKKRLKVAQAGMSMDQEAEIGSATNFAANMTPSKVALLNYNQQNQIKNSAANEFEQYQAAANQPTDQEAPLEQAKWGRARARRRMRRMNNAMNDMYSGIAMPPGVAPMMTPGMPAMGPSVMDTEAKFGFLGGLRELKMHQEYANQMPVNFGQDAFINGLYNPMSMMNSGSFMYDIIYPGTKEDIGNNITGNPDNKVVINNDTDHDGTGNDGNGNDGSDPTSTENTPPPGGCGAGMKWDPLVTGSNGKKGACVSDGKRKPCSNDRKFNELSGECECKDPQKTWKASEAKCVPLVQLIKENNDGTPWGWILAMGAGSLYAGKKFYNYMKSRNLKPGPAMKLLTGDIAAGKEKVADFFSKTPVDANDIKIVDAGKINTTGVKQLGTTYKPPRALPPPKVPLQISGPTSAPKGLPAPEIKTRATPKLSNTAKRKMRLELSRIPKNDKVALQKFINRNSKLLSPHIPLKKMSKWSFKHAVRAIGKVVKGAKEFGGEIDETDMLYGNPDLYRFTGGGQGVDYFSEGGYYEDSGVNDFETMGQPAYKNVFDPYMSYGNQGQGPDPTTPYTILTLMTNPPRFKIVDENFRSYGVFNTREEAQAVLQSLSEKDNRPFVAPMSGGDSYNEGDLYNYGGMTQDDIGKTRMMDANQIAQFMAAGGVVEFLD